MNIITYCLIVGSTIVGLLAGEASLQLFYRLQEGDWVWENSAFRIGYTQPVNDRRREMPGVYFFDMRPVMDSQDRDMLYVDFIHHTPEGNRLVADTLFEFLMKDGMVTPLREAVAE